MRTQKYLPDDVVNKLKKLRVLILQKFESQGNFALVIGEPEALISRVLNGRRYLRPHERELWAQILGTDLSIFPDPPNFRRNNDIVPNYSPGGKVD